MKPRPFRFVMKLPQWKPVMAAAGLALLPGLRVDEVPGLDPALQVSATSLEAWNDWRLDLFIHWGSWSETEVD